MGTVDVRHMDAKRPQRISVRMFRYLLRKVWYFGYNATLFLLRPINSQLVNKRGAEVFDNSVLHISAMVHVPYHTTRILRKTGLKADYMAIGTNPVWDKCDYRVASSKIPVFEVLREFIVFWKIVAKYEIVHLHFALFMSRNGWELPVLKRLGRKIVVHYRGCEIRDPKINKRLHPKMNICEDCDYEQLLCSSPYQRDRILLTKQYADAFLITTPDLKDFAPKAEHITFFSPEKLPPLNRSEKLRFPNRPLKIIHATNHPGIEGSATIQQTIENLKGKGYAIEFVFLKGVPHSRVLKEMSDADLSIGKMKMGYFANAQIESLSMGVPAITWVRPEFMTDQLRKTGFIFTHLNDLEKTMEYYLKHPEELEKKTIIARESILGIHDNSTISKQYIMLYERLKKIC